MEHFSSMFNGLARSFSRKKGGNSWYCGAKNDIVVVERESKKNESSELASAFSKRGEKGVNQDCFIIWEEFGCQEDTIFCGIFDGHGPWGHYVAKRVRDKLPSSLLCNWQQIIAEDAAESELLYSELDTEFNNLNVWKRSYLKACASVDQDLEHHHRIDTFNSGTTALTIVKQGELLVVSNVGDSRAVLGTTSDDGTLVPIQLTVDFKPNLPQEAKRIKECNGRVFCLKDEPGVHRVWLPHEDSPGLAMSRAFGDYCIKNYGLISVPEVTQTRITNKDQFVVLASDGVWDVVSNEEAVEIVYSTPERAKSAKRLVKFAARAWRRKRKGIAMDDISVVCLFFHPSPLLSSPQLDHSVTDQ